jgi:hypothetical protein
VSECKPLVLGHHHQPLERVISGRRSHRDFAPADEATAVVHLWEVGQLCWAAQGVTAPPEDATTADDGWATPRPIPFPVSKIRALSLFIFGSKHRGGTAPGGAALARRWTDRDPLRPRSPHAQAGGTARGPQRGGPVPAGAVPRGVRHCGRQGLTLVPGAYTRPLLSST